MNFTKKFIRYCVVIFLVSHAALCSDKLEIKENYMQKIEACLVKYLQNKGKLTRNFQTALPASSVLCRFITPWALQTVNDAASDLVEEAFPTATDCLTMGFRDKEVIDYIMKIQVLGVSEALDSREIRLETTRSKFKQELESIASNCQIDQKDFVKLFNRNLGIKNDTLEMVQYEYCLAKYIVDNNVLELDNVEMNPQHITPDSVDCDSIIDADKRKIEEGLNGKGSEKLSQRSMSCIVDSYRSMKMYDWSAVAKVLQLFEVPREQMEVGFNRIVIKNLEFASSLAICDQLKI